ncbi:quinate 5-dehydrogenase [Natranaerobius trueperi]|uniref:Quinate 5-dehydrogenase n=1 Tax=Natranaerobius trueperi TaxID=759412 RepID=A0A226BYL5_9FIRM|nr:quinate 5-dehydrogenase [Natranaerobius trueperi]OWZ83289.1 quinate 5-dehydrogenase [Natranaerobius trueperi]
MKRVVSVSLGSSKRDHEVEQEFLGENVLIERRGMDGSLERMKQTILDLDGHVDAFGLGGMDLFLTIGDRRYLLKDAQKIVSCAKKTPIVDGSGLKNSLERKTIQELENKYNMFVNEEKVLVVSALDRFGMAEKISDTNCDVTYGDLIFSLGLPIPINSLSTLDKVARMALPIIRYLPFKLLYPTGDKQNSNTNRFEKFYNRVNIICGDFHYINKYLPNNLTNKTIITNTVTSEDIDKLKIRGLKRLITTTPSLEGRTFGTNVMEALLVSLKGKKKELESKVYEELLDDLNFSPHIVDFY